MSDLDKMMARISALLAKAESTDFPEEAATYRAKAEEFMARYRIEEEQLISTTGEVLPVQRKIVISDFQAEFRHEHGWLFNAITRHCGVRYLKTTDQNASGAYEWVATVVGYDVDIRLLQMIFTSARLVFGASLEPEIDPNESDADNVYRLRSAGIGRNKIAQMMWGADLGHAGHAAHAKVGRLYKEACEARGEDASVSGRRVNAKAYREAYAMKFAEEFSWRLRQARDAADSAVGSLVSVERPKRVQEAFYTAFPHMRPQPPSEEEKADMTASVSKPRKERRPTKADEMRSYRAFYSPTARAAQAAAETAASKVQLTRPQRATRVERSPGQSGALEG